MKGLAVGFVITAALVLAPTVVLVGIAAAVGIGCVIMASVPKESVPGWLKWAKSAADNVKNEAVKVMVDGPVVLVEDIGQGLMDETQTPEGIASIAGSVVGSIAGGHVGKLIKAGISVPEAGAVAEGGKTSVIYGTDDIAKYEYNMIENPGPLVDMPNQPWKNFYGGKYNVEVLSEDRIMYRGGNSTNPYGRWFSSEPTESIVKVRIDTAVKPQWIDPITGELTGESVVDTVYAIKIPKGTKVYTGPVGTQGGTYVGGYNIMQSYIDAPWGFEVIGASPLK